MEFAAKRERALSQVEEKLRETLTNDTVLVHAWRCVEGRAKALEHWLFAVFPQSRPEKAREKVAQKGADAWSKKGRGAQMDEMGWKALVQVCKGRAPNLDKLAEHAGANMFALVGAIPMAELIEAAGGIGQIARMTQRDAMRLGNESGTFGGPDKKSILEKHKLATNERALRVLSSRVVLAARLDVYKGQFKGESLRQEVLYAQ